MDSNEPKEKPTESPDVVIEHGQTKFTLDLDGWEWFWLFLAVCFVGSLYVFFG